MYSRSDVTNDSITSISSNGNTLIGTIQKYVSRCQQGCTSCSEGTYCRHFTIVAVHPTYEFGVVDDITNATAPHVNRF